MNRPVLVAVLIFALAIGVGAVLFYYAQNYTYSLDLENDISTSNIHVTLSYSPYMWNGTGMALNESERKIEFISMPLGKMKFKNEGVISRVIEVPRLFACFDLTNTKVTMGFKEYPHPVALWPIYTTYEPVFINNSKDFGSVQVMGSGIVTEIYPQSTYGNYYDQQPIEVNAGDELVYYISLKKSNFYAHGQNSVIFKNGKIEIYELPTKEFNPISQGVTYDSLIYNPTCDVLARELDPVGTIEII